MDTGGHHTHEAYNFVKARARRRVYAIKGSNQPWRDIVATTSTKNKSKVLLHTIGTDTAKETIVYRLKIVEPGPGYVHFSKDLTETYYKGLTAEKLVVDYDKGKEVRKWVKVRERNEALDTSVYAIAALNILRPNWLALARSLQALAPEKPGEEKPKPGRKRKRKMSGLD